MKKRIYIVALLIVAGFSTPLLAQWHPFYRPLNYMPVGSDPEVYEVPDSVMLPKWEPHLHVGTGFMGTSYGDNRLYTSVSPSIIYRPTNKLSFAGGFNITTDMGLNPNYNIGKTERSLIPYRNGGTGLASAYVEAEYQVGENVWLSGSIYHMGGTYAPVYGWGNGNVYDVSVTAVSAAAAFRFKNDSFLHISFTYLRDNFGTMPYMMHDAWHSGFGGWGMNGSPYGCSMYSPAMMYGGWY